MEFLLKNYFCCGFFDIKTEPMCLGNGVSEASFLRHYFHFVKVQKKTLSLRVVQMKIEQFNQTYVKPGLTDIRPHREDSRMSKI